jgi:hypothetical protein
VADAEHRRNLLACETTIGLCHTDSYAPGSKCLHVVIPSELERRLTRDFGIQGTAGQIPPSLSVRFSIPLQSEFRRADSESPLIVEALLFDLVSRHLNIIRDIRMRFPA